MPRDHLDLLGWTSKKASRGYDQSVGRIIVNLQLEVSSKAVTALREDLGDGSYRLIFNAERTGTFRASVLIDGIHVANSPSVLQITSTVPDLSQCRVHPMAHSVLKKETVRFRIEFRDEFGNPTKQVRRPEPPSPMTPPP